VTAIRVGALLSSGTTSLSHMSSNGSARARQYRRGVCEGNVTVDGLSMRRALRSLMPALADANSWVLCLRCFHVEANLVIGDDGSWHGADLF
jgi:hypothetical protein